MNVSEDVPTDHNRRIAVRRRPVTLLVLAAMAASWMAAAATGATPPGNNAAEPGSTQSASSQGNSSSADLRLLREARKALFEESKPAEARKKAAAALKLAGIEDLETRAEALYLEMQAAALEGDNIAMMSAAQRLCKMSDQMENDPRVRVARSRLSGQKNATQQAGEVAPNPAENLIASLAPQGPDSQSAQATSAPPQHLPPCQTLRAAAKFLSKHARYEKSNEVSQILGHCAPDLLASAAPAGVAPVLGQTQLPVFLTL